MIQFKEKDNWEWKPLKYIFNYFLSSVDRKIKEEELNVHICHYPDVYKNEKISNKDNLNKGTCTEFELENFKLKKGDILITKDSEDPKDIGIPCLVENDLFDSVCGYHIGILRTNENIEREFYFRYIQSTDVKDYFFCESNGITRFGLGKSSVENLKIPIMSIQEQKIISQYLNKKTSQIDSLIEKIEKKIELLKEQKTVLINKFVTKGLDPNVAMKDSGFEWIGDIPKSWVKIKIKYLTEDHRQGFYSADPYDEEGIPILRITDINEQNKFDIENSPKYNREEKQIENFYLQKGDFLFPRTGGVGRFGIIDFDDICIYGSFLIRFRFNNKFVTKKFMKFYFLTEFFKSQIKSEIHGGVNQNVHVENIKSCFLFLPNKEEQNYITEKLDGIESEINKLVKLYQTKYDLYKEYRQSLISSVVTGKIRITEDMI